MTDRATRIGKYEVVEQIGEGAMGVVYRAVDPVLNRPVAIKVMSEGMAQDDALRQRFLREAQAAGSLQHPNVVTIYDFGETDGHLFIAMEYIEGTDLEQLLLRGTRIPLPEQLEIVIDVLNGLSYAHRRGIVHRDIKPANIRIDTEGHARIMDFGVAHLSTSNLTSTGVMMGTPNYMAPEQITDGEISAATDLFSVGAVLYELLTNTKPFQADTLHRVLFRIVSDPPPDLHEVAPELPGALRRVVAKALAKDAKERYQTATEMANDLSAVRASLGAPRASRTVSQRSSIERSLMAQRKTVPLGEVTRWKLISGIAAALLLAGLGGGGALWFANRNHGASDATAAAPPPPVIVAGTPREDSVPATPATEPRPNAVAQTATTAPSGSAPSREQPRARAEPDIRSRDDVPSRQPAPRTDVADRPASSPARRDTGRAPSLFPPQPTAAAIQSQSPAPAPVGQEPAPAVVGSSSATTPPAPSPAQPAAADNPRPAVAAVLAAYARAIETRDLAEVRRVYPAMTAAQQTGWSSFFASVRSMTARLEIASLDAGATSAVARVTGAYEFVTRAGRVERQPASFEATFQRDGERWKLLSIR